MALRSRLLAFFSLVRFCRWVIFPVFSESLIFKGALSYNLVPSTGFDGNLFGWFNRSVSEFTPLDRLELIELNERSDESISPKFGTLEPKFTILV